jgi:hypothetical protein
MSKVADNHWCYIDLVDGSKVITYNYSTFVCSPLCKYLSRCNSYFTLRCSKFDLDLYDNERLDQCINLEAI